MNEELPFEKKQRETREYFWEKEKRAIPFLDSLPEKYKVHDELLDCPRCKGELFGRCLCCQMYFCHGACKDEPINDFVFSEEELAELCSGVDHTNDVPEVFKIKDGKVIKVEDNEV
jgi:hypothetical protein